MPEVDIEQQARQLGWVPKEEFKGPEERWVDADEFVRKGEEILPIVRQNNRELSRKLAENAKVISELQKQVQENSAAMADFRAYHEESLTQALEQQRRELTVQLKEARNEGDVDAELKISDQLDDVRQQQKDMKQKKAEEANKPSTKPAIEENPDLHPDFPAWQEDNEWFGKDKMRTRYAMAAAQDITKDPATAHLKGRAFFDEVTKQVFEAFPEDGAARQPSSKVEGGGSTPSRGGSRKGYNDMPADAKAACDRFARTLVGEGKAYKTVDEWRSKYASEFFNS